jgi:hypothetical protein
MSTPRALDLNPYGPIPAMTGPGHRDIGPDYLKEYSHCFLPYDSTANGSPEFQFGSLRVCFAAKSLRGTSRGRRGAEPICITLDVAHFILCAIALVAVLVDLRHLVRPARRRTPQGTNRRRAPISIPAIDNPLRYRRRHHQGSSVDVWTFALLGIRYARRRPRHGFASSRGPRGAGVSRFP